MMNKESGSVDGNGLMAMDEIRKRHAYENALEADFYRDNARFNPAYARANEDRATLLAYIDRLLRLPSREQDGGAALEAESGWWCPECKSVVPGREVTFYEYHQTCGAKVCDRPPAPRHEALPTAREQVRDGLVAVGCPESNRQPGLGWTLSDEAQNDIHRLQSDQVAASSRGAKIVVGAVSPDLTDGDLIRACEHLLFETGRTGVESVDRAIVMVCHDLLGRIFPAPERDNALPKDPQEITTATPTREN